MDSCNEPNSRKIFILDIDVHFGEGTSKLVWNNPQVVFCSIHEWDDGNFYPGLDEGGHEYVGPKTLKGYNINIPLDKGCGDTEYLYAVTQVVIPVLKVFKPDLVVVSAGFDCLTLFNHLILNLLCTMLFDFSNLNEIISHLQVYW